MRPSFVPPREIRELRDFTRYRSALIAERTREKQRVEKLLEDAQIKLSSVASDIFGVSGRHMLQAMIDRNDAGSRIGRELLSLADDLLWRWKRVREGNASRGRFRRSDHRMLHC